MRKRADGRWLLREKMSSMSSKLAAFQKEVFSFYKTHGRHSLPWRKTKDPYKILVSEVMLQQTQVDRVIPFYTAFLKKFPTASALSKAKLSAVLKAWQGLGYNRRAKMLHEAAKAITEKHGGKFPRPYEGILALPGVGPYTAHAVRAFAFNEPGIMIETNIRAAYIHRFFPRSKAVSDLKIVPLVKVPKGKAREWYSALMDYGAHLKKTLPNPSRKSAHHTKQKPFKGSDREIRGAILRALSRGEAVSKLSFQKKRITAQLAALEKEGMVIKKRGSFGLAV